MSQVISWGFPNPAAVVKNKQFIATMVQVGTAAPTLYIHENSLQVQVTASRVSDGIYTLVFNKPIFDPSLLVKSTIVYNHWNVYNVVTVDTVTQLGFLTAVDPTDLASYTGTDGLMTYDVLTITQY
jgi:hypothetical protein